VYRRLLRLARPLGKHYTENCFPSSLQLMKNISLVLVITVICFLAGGGWRLKDTSFQQLRDDISHRSQGDDLTDNVFTAAMMFVTYGGGAAVAGAVATTCVLIFVSKRKKNTNPNQVP